MVDYDKTILIYDSLTVQKQFIITTILEIGPEHNPFFWGGGSDSVLLHRPTTGQDTQSCRSFLASSNRWEDAENE